MRLLKIVLFLILLLGAGLVGFAYLGDLSPDRTEVRQPIDLPSN